ncbi:hypothetical protein Tco_0627056 [Tanacetum coccineum]|uniref:Uncharacterized protein n=1 Tax=Tanacetum coccineum TaxID=301880 RepID=A0ABQ4WLA8_9ASTR
MKMVTCTRKEMRSNNKQHPSPCVVQFRRTSLTRFPAQSIRSSNAVALDSMDLLVLITRMSQSRQHESRKSPTAELFAVDSGRISIHHLIVVARVGVDEVESCCYWRLSDASAVVTAEDFETT